MDDGDLSRASASGRARDFADVPVTLTVTVGRARAAIGTLLTLDRNAVLPLDRAIDDPVTIHAGDRVVAYGELQEMEGDPPGRLAVRITRIAAADDGG